MRPYIETQQIENLGEYATAAVIKDPPTVPQYTDGTIPRATLPAKWWNWFTGKFTKNISQASLAFSDLYGELLDLFTRAVITPGVSGSVTPQLHSVLMKLFYANPDITQRLISANKTIDHTKALVEKFFVDTAGISITFDDISAVADPPYKHAEIINISNGDINIVFGEAGLTPIVLPPQGSVFVFCVKLAGGTYTWRHTWDNPSAEHIFNGSMLRLGLHKAGSAVSFFQATAPTLRNGQALSAADVGLLFIRDSDKLGHVWSGAAFDELRARPPIAIHVAQDTILTVGRVHIVERGVGQTPVQLSLPVSPALGDTITIKALTPCSIVQGDAEHAISWDNSLFTTRGVNGYVQVPANSEVKILYNGAGFILQAPAKLEDPSILPTGNGNGAAWSPDGRYLAVAIAASPFVIIYDWISGSPVKIDNPGTLPTGVGNGVGWSPDGRYLAVTHFASPFVTIYDWISGSPVKIANPSTLPTGNGNDAAWSPDGRYLAVVHSTTPFVTIYDWISGSPVKIVNPGTLPTGEGKGVAWSPDGRYLAVTHLVSPFVTIYDWVSGSPVKIANPSTLPPDNGDKLEWSPDGRYLAVVHSTTPFVTIYDWVSGSPVKIANPGTLPTGDGNGAAWSPDGRYLVIAHTLTPFVAIYDWISGAPVKIANPSTLPANAGVNVTWSPDGRYLAIAHVTAPYITIYDTWAPVDKEWLIDIKADTFRGPRGKNILAPNFH